MNDYKETKTVAVKESPGQSLISARSKVPQIIQQARAAGHSGRAGALYKEEQEHYQSKRQYQFEWWKRRFASERTCGRMAVEHSGEVIEFEWQDTDDHPRHEAVRKLQELCSYWIYSPVSNKAFELVGLESTNVIASNQLQQEYLAARG